jgi:hypothetical protein
MGCGPSPGSKILITDFSLYRHFCTGFDSHPVFCVMHEEEFYFAVELPEHEADPSALIRQG